MVVADAPNCSRRVRILRWYDTSQHLVACFTLPTYTRGELGIFVLNFVAGGAPRLVRRVVRSPRNRNRFTVEEALFLQKAKLVYRKLLTPSSTNCRCTVYCPGWCSPLEVVYTGREEQKNACRRGGVMPRRTFTGGCRDRRLPGHLIPRRHEEESLHGSTYAMSTPDTCITSVCG